MKSFLNRRFISFMLALSMLLCVLPGLAEQTDAQSSSSVITSTVAENGSDMLKYGHIDIAVSADDFLQIYKLGDVVSVDLEGYGSYTVPVCASYDDVDAGSMLLRAAAGKDHLTLAINYGQIAVECGLVSESPRGSVEKYQLNEGVSFPIRVTISPKVVTLTTTVVEGAPELVKYGNVLLDISADDFLAVFSAGDVVTVDVEDYGTYDMPVCASYTDVDAGEMLVRAAAGKLYTILAINRGAMGLKLGLVEDAPDGSETAYQLKDGVTYPIRVTITLKGTSTDENLIGKLVRTNNREDYPGLTDAQYANFRAVTTTGMGSGKLYRASSPINPNLGRNAYADAASAEAGIRTFINLADTESEALAFEGYAATYYQSKNHIFLSLPIAFNTESFQEGFAEGLRFMITSEPPYLIHCKEGKDRSGLVIAVLECLMGASLDEVTEDYTATYRVFYSVENGTQRSLTDAEVQVINQVIISDLRIAFGQTVSAETDLAAAAEAYLLKIGLTESEIAALKKCLE